MKTKKIDPLSERLDKAGIRGGVGKSSRPTLNKKDKQFVVVDKDNKIVTRQPNKQDAKEFVGFANSKFFKNTTMGEKYKKPFKVAPISPKDRIKKDTTKMVKKKNKGGLLVTPKLAQRGF